MAFLRKLRSHTPVTLTATLFLRCNKGVNHVLSMIAGVSDGLWLGVMNDAVLHKVDEVQYRGEARYFRPDYNVRGLLSWERDAIDRYFGRARRLVVTAAGGGREMYTLLGEGYDVTGFECNEQMLRAGNVLLREAGFGDRLLLAPRDLWPELPGVYDGVIIGWGSYIHLRGRAKRVAFLRQARSYVTKDAPLLVSFYVREGDTAYFRIVTTLANGVRWIRRDEPIEIGDSLVPNYAHFFTEQEVRDELAEAGFEMVSFEAEEYARSVALAR